MTGQVGPLYDPEVSPSAAYLSHLVSRRVSLAPTTPPPIRVVDLPGRDEPVFPSGRPYVAAVRADKH